MSAMSVDAGRLTETQRQRLAGVVIALARVESLSRAMRGLAQSTRDIHEDNMASIDVARTALYDVDVLADTIFHLHLDAVEALSQAFPGMSWNYDCPGWEDRDD